MLCEKQSIIIHQLENRIWQRDYRDRRALQPESIYVSEMLPPPSYMDNPINAVTTIGLLFEMNQNADEL